MTYGVAGAEPVLDGITDAIRGFVPDVPEPVVLGYVVVVAFIDADGEQQNYMDTMDGQRAFQSLGLLEFAATHERAEITKRVLDADDE